LKLPKVQGNLALANFGDIFNIGTSADDGERIVEIALTELFAPDCHPFQVNNDEAMARLVKSVKQYGVREPGLVRPNPGGGYELLCGNRRKHACELAGLETMPVIIRELDDDSAVIAMVDSNLQQRERILPSERAFAYRMKMDALNHSGVKADRLSCEIMAEQTGESVAQIFRFIRLTELVEKLLDKVDARQLAFTPAVKLSYLSYDEQHIVAEYMAQYEIKPSLSQAVRMKKLKQDGKLTEKAIDEVLSAEKKPPREDTSLSRFKRYFPADYTPKQMTGVIDRLLREWQAAQA
jgi:ParB family chromosome partitioning protein